MVHTKLGWFVWFLNVRNTTPLENCVNILRSKTTNLNFEYTLAAYFGGKQAETILDLK